MRDMLLGLQLGYWGSGPPPNASALVSEAERLGFDSVWTAEAYGSDALTPLSWWGSQTSRVRLGTALCQLSARTPTAMAMAALTLDHLSGGRFVLVLAREAPVTNDRPNYPLPYPGGTGLGKPLKSIVHPLRKAIPIIMGAEGPKNVALAAEIADGWFPIFFSPIAVKAFEPALAEGFGRPGARHAAEDFEVIALAPTIIDDDIERAADMMRPSIALYIGGMGAKSMNFHFDVFSRMGYEAEATKIQELYLAGHKDEAVAAVPTSLIEDTALIGPKEKIRDDLEGWRESIATTLLVAGNTDTLQTMAELVL
jgi:alkanesulfonate monooxygenase SsuD/methylene tetrahydromethanopterin reductase-like flavin-dependent oxidoreductase (luciferase family)